MDILKDMFPSVEHEVILAVFEANGENTELTIAALLAMSDPNAPSKNAPLVVPKI